jgi:hypothetical protein
VTVFLPGVRCALANDGTADVDQQIARRMERDARTPGSN